MRRLIGYVVGAVTVVVTALGAVFVLGMRAKSPVVLDTVRSFGRATKSLAMRTAGQPGAYAAVVHHVGRRSGSHYATPVGAVRTEDGFVIALPYGPNTDWLKNVVASGSATIVEQGVAHLVAQPELIPIGDADAYFSAADQRTHRLFRVEQCLRVTTVETMSSPAPMPT